MLTRNLDSEQKREEFLAELNAPADPWEAANKVWADLGLPTTGGG